MKKIVLLLPVVLLSMLSCNNSNENTNQNTDTTTENFTIDKRLGYIIQDGIDKRFLLIGIEHNLSDSQNAQLFCNESLEDFSKAWTLIQANVKNKKLAIIIEGFSDQTGFYFKNSNQVMPGITWPNELSAYQDALMVGSDTRKRYDLSKQATYVLDTFIKGRSSQKDDGTYYLDSIGYRAIFRERNDPYITQQAEYLYNQNAIFEKALISNAEIYYNKNYSVLIICGALHAARLNVKYKIPAILCGLTENGIGQLRYSYDRMKIADSLTNSKAKKR